MTSFQTDPSRDRILYILQKLDFCFLQIREGWITGIIISGSLLQSPDPKLVVAHKSKNRQKYRNKWTEIQKQINWNRETNSLTYRNNYKRKRLRHNKHRQTHYSWKDRQHLTHKKIREQRHRKAKISKEWQTNKQRQCRNTDIERYLEIKR